MALIVRGESKQIRPNFNSSEFQQSWNKGYTLMDQQYNLSDRTLDAVQDVRTESGVGIIITSSLRFPKHNKAVKGASSSRHLPRYNGGLEQLEGVTPTGDAIDFKFKDQHIKGSEGHKAMLDLQEKLLSDDWKSLPFIVSNGINGVGIYEDFFHFDSRPSAPVRFGSLYKKKTLVGNVVENYFGDGDDGVQAVKPQLKKWLPAIIGAFLFVALITGYLIYKKRKK